jgi:hypothetical protein
MIAMCYGGVKARYRIKNAIIIEVPAIPRSLVWLHCRGKGYPDNVSIDATLAHYKGISRQRLCCRCCHRTQHESERGHHDILNPSILFHNLPCSYLVMSSLIGELIIGLDLKNSERQLDGCFCGSPLTNSSN